VANRPLSPTDLAVIDALDAGADLAICGDGEYPVRWYEDTLGTHGSIGLYPTPSDAAELALVFLQQPELFASTASTAPIPRCLKTFIEDYVLAEAWAHNSDFAMPELAAHFREKRNFHLELYRAYWGPAQ
jgi:hypothetical protein